MKTDMNHRERDAFAKQFTSIAGMCNNLAEALRLEDDERALTLLLILNLTGGQSLMGLIEVFHEAGMKEQMNRDLGGL